MKQVASIVGFARLFPLAICYFVSRLVLSAFNATTRSKPPSRRLALAWRFIQKFPIVFYNRARFKNRFRTNWQSIVYCELLQTLGGTGDDLVPTCVIHGEAVLRSAISSDQPLVVLAVHSGFTKTTLKALGQHGKDIAFLSVNKNPADWLQPYHVKATVNTIVADSGSLLALRNALEASMVVFGCIDFTFRSPSSLDHVLCASSGLVSLARLCKAHTVYSHAMVDEAGIVHIYFDRPSVNVENLGSQEHVRDFLSFVETVSGIKPDRQIVDPNSVQMRTRVDHRIRRRKKLAARQAKGE